MQMKVMGVLRVAPAAFAEGDRSPDRAAVARGRQMISEGADIVEVACAPVGAGRPAVDPVIEERTILGVVEALAGDIRVAIATRSAPVAAAAVAAGATLLTDATAAPGRDSLPGVAAAAGAGWVAVHDAGTLPRAPDARAPGNGSGGRHLLGDMVEALGARVTQASAAGVAEIYVDPGIGTGRAANDDLDLLGGLDRLADLGRPLVVGTGDGRLIDVLHDAADTGGDGPAIGGRSDRDADRLEGALVVAVWVMLAGAAIVRTHHVAATIEAARIVGAKPPVGTP